MLTHDQLMRRITWKLAAMRQTRNRCMGCSKRFTSGDLLDVHEIERRSQAPGHWAHRCNYLLLCRECHTGPFDSMPHAEQLAYKLLWDTMHFDLERWLRLRDADLTAPERITIEEVYEAAHRVRRRLDEACRSK
jgi:hypothetical protein